MNDFFLSSANVGVTISLAAYFLGRAVQKRWKLAIFNPLLISVVLVILFLLAAGIDYGAYHASAKYLSWLLPPATVSLAIPLYRQLELLKKNAAAIMTGIASGVLTNLLTVLSLSLTFGLSRADYVTLLPKSVTTAIGMSVSEELGGNGTITAAVIIVTGILGNMTAETLCRLFRIRHAVSKGLAVGTASHAIGTAKALEMGEVEGAMSGMAIVVSGLCTVAGAAVFAAMY